MLYRTVKNTGDSLSVLGFGCMRLPGGEEKIDEERAARQIRYAIDGGVNYLDTAYLYHRGACEPFLGKILSQDLREKVKLATKMPHWVINSPKEMEIIFRSQLERLKTEYIDYYLLHALDRKVWEKMKGLGALDFLERAKREGLILNTGFSFHGDLAIFKEIVNSYSWNVCQIQYNFLDEKNQAGTEGLEYAAARGLGVIVMEPLRGGNLTKRIPSEVMASWNEAKVRRSPAEWALRWVWNRPEVTVVLSGMNQEEHVEENLRAADEAYPNSLTEEELQLIKRVEEAYRRLMKVGCTGCGYCMPCPQGVNIPGCLEIYNNKFMFGDERADFMYMARYCSPSVSPSYASLCDDCGSCAELCPQHLPIPDLLREVANAFDRRLLN